MKKIRAFFKVGQRVLDRAKQDGLKNDTAARVISKKGSLGFDAARNAHRFARRFDEQALNKLLDLCRAPEHTPLTVNHIRRALRTGNSSEMLTWLARAAKEGWTAKRLDREIPKQTRGESKPIGSPLKEPANLVEVLDQVQQQSDAWLKRYKQRWSLDKYWPPTIGFGEVEPTTLSEQIREARSRLVRVREATEELERRLSSVDLRVKGKSRKEGVGQRSARVSRSSSS